MTLNIKNEETVRLTREERQRDLEAPVEELLAIGRRCAGSLQTGDPTGTLVARGRATRVRAAMHPAQHRCSSVEYGPVCSLIAPCWTGA